MTITLEQLYEMQKELDTRIIREKGLEGKDLLPNTVLALQVELAECANEWRGFKHWSKDQEPRRAKMLEEYVDCLHFFLSIARQLDLPADDLNILWEVPTDETTILFRDLLTAVGLIDYDDVDAYYDAWKQFNELGTRLGFTFDQIAEAYLKKNRENHTRQENGY